MIKAKAILDFLDTIMNYEEESSWDNSGLQLGNSNNGVGRLGVCFHADNYTIKKAVKSEVNMLVTHHPLFLPKIRPLDKITQSDYENIRLLVNNDIVVASYHTCWDCANGGIRDTYSKLLGIKEIFKKCGLVIGDITPVDFNELLMQIKEKFKVKNVRPYGIKEGIIKRIGFANGSGFNHENIETCIDYGVQAFISGDAKDAVIRQAIDSGILCIDAGHYGTEHLGVKELARQIKKKFKNLEVIYIDSEEV